MSAMEHPGTGGEASDSAGTRAWQAVAQALNWLDGKNNPYSPAICVSMLLLVGLIVKLSPGLHAVLLHN